MTRAGDRRTPVAIELRDIVKRFPGVVANDGVNLTVRAGSVHAIVGENGAGKSTLMKTLYGAHRPDEGTIVVDGERAPLPLAGRRHRRRHRHGVPALHARRQLHGVGEHRARQRARHARATSTSGEARRRIRELADAATASTSIPTRWSSDLGVGEKQRVEILKVLYRGARILILDEPTAVLVPQEVDELFALAARAHRRTARP